MAILSSSLNWFTNTFIDSFSNGSLLTSLMEPDTSIKNTKLDLGKLSVGMSLPCKPMRTNLLVLFHGQSLYSVLIENGCCPVGCGYWYLKKLTISSTRTASFGTV